MQNLVRRFFDWLWPPLKVRDGYLVTTRKWKPIVGKDYTVRVTLKPEQLTD